MGLIVVLLTMLVCCRGERRKPVNIILISVDSLRADHVHSYGYSKRTTPNLDRLADQGVLFETVVAESSWTLPTHMTMLTGLSAASHGMEYSSNSPLNPDHRTLAGMLRQAGYQTRGLFSGPYLHPIFGFGEGFDRYESVGGQIAYDEDGFSVADGRADTERKIRAVNHASHRTITSPEVTERAIDFLSEEHGKPFFLFLHYFDVHYDYNPPEDVWRQFDPDYRGQLTGENYDRNPAVHARMSRADLEHVVALYDGEIRFTDEYLGRLIDTVDRNGLSRDTLIVVTSDHGQEFFEHGNKGHLRTLYDEVLLVPMVMRLPGVIPSGLRIKEQIRHLDLTPTLLAFAGIRDSLAGVDLSGVLTGRTAPESYDAMSRLHRNGWLSSLRTPELKYIIRRTDNEDTETLFDLTEDPGESDPVIRNVFRFRDRARVSDWGRLRDAVLNGEASELASRPPPEARSGPEGELPEDLKERLRSLGYIQ